MFCAKRFNSLSLSSEARKIKRLAASFVKCENGATAIEYTLIAAGIGLAVSATVYNVGAIVLNDLFNNIANAVGN